MTPDVHGVGTESMVFPEYLMVIDLIVQRRFPPTLFMVTMMSPDDVELGAEIVGPGMDSGVPAQATLEL